MMTAFAREQNRSSSPSAFYSLSQVSLASVLAWLNPRLIHNCTDWHMGRGGTHTLCSTMQWQSTWKNHFSFTTSPIWIHPENQSLLICYKREHFLKQGRSLSFVEYTYILMESTTLEWMVFCRDPARRAVCKHRYLSCHSDAKSAERVCWGASARITVTL